MAQHIYHCSACRSYTLAELCPRCGQKTLLPRPPKFSLDDKYAPLRREARKEGWREKGLY